MTIDIRDVHVPATIHKLGKYSRSPVRRSVWEFEFVYKSALVFTFSLAADLYTRVASKYIGLIVCDIVCL